MRNLSTLKGSRASQLADISDILSRELESKSLKID